MMRIELKETVLWALDNLSPAENVRFPAANQVLTYESARIPVFWHRDTKATLWADQEKERLLVLVRNKYLRQVTLCYYRRADEEFKVRAELRFPMAADRILKMDRDELKADFLHLVGVTEEL